MKAATSLLVNMPRKKGKFRVQGRGSGTQPALAVTCIEPGTEFCISVNPTPERNRVRSLCVSNVVNWQITPEKRRSFRHHCSCDLNQNTYVPRRQRSLKWAG